MSLKYIVVAILAFFVMSTLVFPEVIGWSPPESLPEPEEILAPINARLELVELVETNAAVVLSGASNQPKMTLGVRPKKGTGPGCNPVWPGRILD